MRRVFRDLVMLGLGLPLCQAQETYRLDPTASVIQIHLDTAGALGFMGDAHLIQTPIERGKFVYYAGDAGRSSVEVEVDASALQVIDPKLSAKDRKKIQAKMESDRVLDIQRHPKIVFKSVKIEALDGSRLRVTGNLTIRGQTRPVILQVSLEEAGTQLKAAGNGQFKQTTFGIRPVSAGLGTVRVKDEMNISYQVLGHAAGGVR